MPSGRNELSFWLWIKEDSDDNLEMSLEMSFWAVRKEDVNADLSSMYFRYEVPGIFFGVALLFMYLYGGVGSGISFREVSSRIMIGLSSFW